MLKNAKLQVLLVLAVGGLLGYFAATGKLSWLLGADDAKTAPPSNDIQVTGVLGSPSATTTIDGKKLPNAPPPFGGVIKQNEAQSKAWWPPRVVPPKGAPNVLLIMTDDVGCAAPSTFGGVIPTPALDRVAKAGLRYTNFHSVSLCSPSRQALITGRNHHSVGFGMLGEDSNGFPGYNAELPKDKATLGRILLGNGYRTSWFGKNDATPIGERSQAGPFDHWPTGLGYEFFYGFNGGDTSQWQPGNLHRNTTSITPFVVHPGWNLTTAMADEAVHWLNHLTDLNPSMPFLVYYAPGGSHVPYHQSKELVETNSVMYVVYRGWI